MNIGLIGCGSIAQVHTKCIAAIGGDRRLTAVSDCVDERAAVMAKEYGAAAYRDWREMLEREPLDMVHICTPHHLHTPMAAAALKKGIPVFMEKPPVISREQFDELKSALLSGGRLAVCFQNRLNPSVQYVKTLLREGRFGRIIGMRGFVTWCRKAAYYAESPWRGSRETEGGGALINQGIHTLDLMQYLAECPPVGADAFQGNFHLADQIEVEDTLAAYIRYPDAQAVLYVTTAYTADAAPMIELHCEEGHIRIEDDGVRILRNDGSQEDMRFPAAEGLGKKYWGSAHQDAIEGFYRSVENKTPYLLDFDNVEDTVKLMLRIYEAARSSYYGR